MKVAGSPKVSRINLQFRMYLFWLVFGDWPSGKAPGSGPVIGGSNPSSPAIQRVGSFDPTFCIVEVGLNARSANEMSRSGVRRSESCRRSLLRESFSGEATERERGKAISLIPSHTKSTDFCRCFLYCLGAELTKRSAYERSEWRNPAPPGAIPHPSQSFCIC